MNREIELAPYLVIPRNDTLSMDYSKLVDRASVRELKELTPLSIIENYSCCCAAGLSVFVAALITYIHMRIYNNRDK